MEDFPSMDLTIAGLTGAISKMLLNPANELFDFDDYIDEEFGSDYEFDTTGCKSTEHHTIVTTQTDETTDASSGCETPNSDIEESRQSSIETLDPRTDPFAPRIGKTLLWRNINMTLVGKKGKPDRQLLKNVWGEVPETETTAIMGASGAGKTSLLNILAGRATTSGRIRIEADVRLNNYAVDPTNITVRKFIAFVAQDDSLPATATPRESIRFSAKLRLPKSTKEAQLDQLASRMVNELGLSSCADTIVGGPLIKGISGGERKRTSVGVELVVKPNMVFLDEPTSGLDSFSSVQVCQVLKKVATAGSSVLFTIHQPSSEIFTSFDRLILMHKGCVMFQGPVPVIPDHFARLGYPVPANYNPADWVIDVAQRNSVIELQKHGFFRDDDRVIEEPLIPGRGQDALGQTVVNDSKSIGDEAKHGIWTQTRLLVNRELIYNYRFPAPVYARLGISAFLSMMCGVIYWGVGQTDPANQFNLTSQLGAIMILMVFSILGCAQPAILFFPEERPIFVREYSTNHYSVIPYFLSRLLVEVILTFLQLGIINTVLYTCVKFRGRFWMFLAVSYALAMTSTAIAVTIGCLSRGNAKVAMQALPIVLLPQFLFSGFFVSPDLIPKFLQWMQYLAPLSYAVKLISVEEFSDCSESFMAQINCDMLLQNLGANPADGWFNWLMLLVLFVLFRLTALWVLQRGAGKFY